MSVVLFGCGQQSSPEQKSAQPPPTTGSASAPPQAPPRRSPVSDAEAMKAIERVRQGLVQFGSVNDDQLRALKDVYREYGDSDVVMPVLMQALAITEDWFMLADIIQRTPIEMRTQQQHVMLVQALLKLGRYHDAVETLLPLIKHNPANVELRVLAAHAYSFLNEYDRAADLLDEVWDRAMEERNAEACLVRGQIYFYQGDDVQAQNTIDRGLQMDSASASMQIRMHNAMARVLAAMNDTAGAEDHAARSTELYAALTAQEHRMMRLSAQSQALNEAMVARQFAECERIILEMLPNADRSLQASLYQYLAQVYDQLDRPDEARAAIERARQLGDSLP